MSYNQSDAEEQLKEKEKTALTS